MATDVDGDWKQDETMVDDVTTSGDTPSGQDVVPATDTAPEDAAGATNEPVAETSDDDGAPAGSGPGLDADSGHIARHSVHPDDGPIHPELGSQRRSSRMGDALAAPFFSRRSQTMVLLSLLVLAVLVYVAVSQLQVGPTSSIANLG